MPKIHMIGNAHLDPVWLWRWTEGFSEVMSTFRSALDRMREFPDFKFTSACAAYYELVEKIDPAMFAEIQQRVAEGRWNIVGGWYIQPDCNIPDGESFARQGLISQRYFRERFGVMAKSAYNVDSFGHTASLPKIFKASGMDQYVFQRPSLKEQGGGVYIFNWEGDDGTTVPAFRIPETYLNNTPERIQTLLDLAEENQQDMMLFYGVGNHGGGPTIELLEMLNGMDFDKVYSTPDQFFEELDTEKLPVHHGELQHHARGCYSAYSEIKRANRECEQSLLAAEKICLLAEKLTGHPYPAEALKKAWKNVLFNHFHDVMCGCSIKKAYRDAAYFHGETMRIAQQETYYAMQKIAWNIDTLAGETLPSRIQRNWKTWEHEVLGIPVVLFNPHTWPVKALFAINEDATKVTDEAGNEVAFQRVRGDQTNGKNDLYNTAFVAELPPLGYTTYRFFTRKVAEKEMVSSLSVGESHLENSKIRAEFDRETGDICRLYDKRSGKYIIDHVCRAVLLDETDCDTWAHNQKDLGQTVAVFTEGAFKVIETGPVRATLRSCIRFGDSVITRDFTLLEGDDRLVVNATVDFHEKHRALKLTFPLTRETVIAKIPYGSIERTGYTGEEPCGNFMVSGDLAVANDSKYAYDTEKGELRMTVLRGAIFADHYGVRDEHCEFMDMGEHRFTYSLFPHRSMAQTERAAAELNCAPGHILGSFHGGDLPETMSCFACDSDNVAVTCIKKSEDGQHVVLRCFETNGQDTETEVKLFGKNFRVALKGRGLKTYDEEGKERNILEFEV